MAFIEPLPYYPVIVSELRSENERTKTLVFTDDLPWSYLAGEHCVLRLTDERGYIAARDYSISSAPSSGRIELTIQREKGGEVSGWIHERLKAGDEVLISNPLGKDFTWTSEENIPILLLAGGIGIAPLMSILREHRFKSADSRIHLAYSVRSRDDICFRDELTPLREEENVRIWLSQESSAPTGYLSGRISADTLRPLLLEDQKVFICGPTSFVDDMEKLIHFELDIPADRILTERFG